MRRWSIVLALVVSAVFAVAMPAAGARAATTPPPASDAPVTIQTTPPLERDLSECLSALPKPGCGHAPEQAGDRGGWLQWTLFGMMICGLVFIGWRVVAGVRNTARRDA